MHANVQSSGGGGGGGITNIVFDYYNYLFEFERKFFFIKK